MAAEGVVAENEVEMGEVEQGMGSEEPGARSQSIGSPSDVIYTPSEEITGGKYSGDASDAGGLEFEVGEETVGLLAEAADEVDRRVTEKKGRQQTAPTRSAGRATMSKLWTSRIIQDLSALNQELTSESEELKAKVATLEARIRGNNIANDIR